MTVTHPRPVGRGCVTVIGSLSLTTAAR